MKSLIVLRHRWLGPQHYWRRQSRLWPQSDACYVARADLIRLNQSLDRRQLLTGSQKWDHCRYSQLLGCWRSQFELKCGKNSRLSNLELLLLRRARLLHRFDQRESRRHRLNILIPYINLSATCPFLPRLQLQTSRLGRVA